MKGQYPFFFHLPSMLIVSLLKSFCAHVNETSSERLKPVVANNLKINHFGSKNETGHVLNSSVFNIIYSEFFEVTLVHVKFLT